MKKLTRVVAWLYIIPQIPAIIILAVVILLLAAGCAGFVKPVQTMTVFDRVLSFGACLTLALAVLGICLVNVLPWIYLLKRRRWAWWWLIFDFGLGCLAAIFPLLRHHAAWAGLKSDLVCAVWMLAFTLPTFLVLLSDRPHGKRKRRRTRSSRGRQVKVRRSR